MLLERGRVMEDLPELDVHFVSKSNSIHIQVNVLESFRFGCDLLLKFPYSLVVKNVHLKEIFHIVI
jgi:hypothetical protein